MNSLCLQFSPPATSIKGVERVHYTSFTTDMAQKYVFHFLGDSNISRYLPVVQEAKSDAAVRDAMLTRVVNAVQLKEALSNPTEVRPTLIIAALTNLITSSYFESFDSLKVYADRTFNDVLNWLTEGRQVLEGFGTRVRLIRIMFGNNSQIRLISPSNLSIC